MKNNTKSFVEAVTILMFVIVPVILTGQHDISIEKFDPTCEESDGYIRVNILQGIYPNGPFNARIVDPDGIELFFTDVNEFFEAKGLYKKGSYTVYIESSNGCSYTKNISLSCCGDPEEVNACFAKVTKVDYDIIMISGDFDDNGLVEGGSNDFYSKMTFSEIKEELIKLIPRANNLAENIYMKGTNPYSSVDIPLIYKDEYDFVSLYQIEDGIYKMKQFYINIIETRSNQKSSILSEGFSIYPNPSNGTLYYKNLDDEFTVDEINIFNSEGKLEFSYIQPSNIELFENLKLKPGLYFFQVVREDLSEEFKKIVIIK